MLYAKEYARNGVTVNSIAPAAIDTELNSFLTPEGRAKLIQDIPVGRFSTPQEFADIVMFLASDSAECHGQGGCNVRVERWRYGS